MRQLNLLDRCIHLMDQTLKLAPQEKTTAHRSNPALTVSENNLLPHEIEHSIGLMRVNHAGEIAAQGLYQGQALTAKLANTREQMEKAAQEEVDHLAWCKERLAELGGRTSYLDPLWYVGAVMIGTIAGAAGDRWSLGFIAETEKQVSAHLQNHLNKVSAEDHKTQKILAQMKFDEEQHAANALALGGALLPSPIRILMRLASKVMVKTSYSF